MSKRRRFIIAACLVCAGIVLTIVLVGRAGREGSPPETSAVIRGDIVITAPLRGNLQMPDKTYLSFGVTGTVTEVLVNRGDEVEKGQILATLDAPALEMSVETARLQVDMARLQVRTAQAQYEKAKNGWEVPEGWESLEDAIGFLAGFLAPDEDTAKASLDMAKLNLKVAELNLESAELNLEKAVIVAPFDGVVADIAISEGEEISGTALATPAVSLIGLGQLELRGFLDELDVAAVKQAQNVTIVVDALRDAELRGTVAFVSPIGVARLGVVSYETVIALDESYEGLMDGMSATADIVIERRDNVLIIPNRAIRGTREKPVVILEIDGQVEEREVILGLSDGINSEVLSGLQEGDRVVLPARSGGSGNLGPF